MAAAGSIVSLDIVEPARTFPPQKATVDRGYAWVIMVTVFVTNFCTVPVPSAHTLFYQEYLVRFQINAATAGWVLGLSASIRFLTSPVIGLLYQKFSLRTIGMAGSITYAIGILLTGFATEMWMLYTGRILLGVGGCMLSMSSFIIVPQYFANKRGLAMGIITSGITSGYMVFPPLIARSLSMFGYTETLVIMACVSVQTLVTTSLYRPQPPAPTDDQSLDTPSKSSCQRFAEKTGLKLLCSPVIVFYMILVASIHILHAVGNIFVSGLAMENTDLTLNEVAMIISAAAFGSLSKIPVGLCFDLQRIRAHRMYLFCAVCMCFGLWGMVLAFMSNKIAFGICYVAFEIAMSVVHSQHITILGDLVPLEQLPSAYALCRTFVGVAFLFGPAGVGRVKDYWDSFQYGFILISTIHMFLVAGFTIVYFCWKKCKTDS